MHFGSKSLYQHVKHFSDFVTKNVELDDYQLKLETSFYKKKEKGFGLH